MKYYAIKLNFQAQKEVGEGVKDKLVSNDMLSNSKKNVFFLKHDDLNLVKLIV